MPAVVAVGSLDCPPETLLDVTNRFRPAGQRMTVAREVAFGCIPLAPSMQRNDHSYSPEGGQYPIDCHGSHLRETATPPRDASSEHLEMFEGASSAAVLTDAAGARSLLVVPHHFPDANLATVIRERFTGTVRYSIVSTAGLTCADEMLGAHFPILLTPHS